MRKLLLVFCNPFYFQYNSITNINRIGFESQCNVGTSAYPAQIAEP